MSLVARVEQFIQEENLFREEDSIVVAVSGGPDSAALLHILFVLSEKWKWNLIAAHMDHQFRGEESERDAEFVAKWCESLHIPCEVAHINVPEYIEQTGMNAQAAARELRYQYLHQVADRNSARCIATAHYADDQAETVLMRLIQGTGPSGLAGMPVRRKEKKVELIRPLIRIYKSEIIHYCEMNHISYCVDSSNLERDYTRNRIRLDVIPLLQQYNPSLPQSLNRLADMLRMEDDFLSEWTEQICHKLVQADEQGYQMSAAEFSSLHIALQRRLLRHVMKQLAHQEQNLDYAAIELARNAVLSHSSPNASIHLTDQIWLSREYDQIRIHRTDLRMDEDYEEWIPGFPWEYQNPLSGQVLQFCQCSKDELPDHVENPFHDRFDKNQAIFDLDQLSLPLRIRNRRPGDRMEVMGLNGTKKVKDIYIDAKVPQRMRHSTPLIIDANDRILWIAGVRRSVHALVTETTKRLLIATIHHKL